MFDVTTWTVVAGNGCSADRQPPELKGSGHFLRKWAYELSGLKDGGIEREQGTTASAQREMPMKPLTSKGG